MQLVIYFSFFFFKDHIGDWLCKIAT